MAISYKWNHIPHNPIWFASVVDKIFSRFIITYHVPIFYCLYCHNIFHSMCVPPTMFILLSVRGMVFPLSAMMSNVVMYVFIYAETWKHIFVVLRYMPDSEVIYVISDLNLLRDGQTIFQGSNGILYSRQQYMRVLIPPHPHEYSYWLFFCWKPS